MWQGLPIYYDYQNAYDSILQPSTVHIHDTALARYFKRYLLIKAISVFKWKIPDTWDYDYFAYILFCMGHIAVINTDKFGVIPQHCTLSGYGIYYQPTTALISNPLLSGLKELRIGVQTELIKLNLDYCGILDIINYYGDLMALAAESAGTNLLNCRLAYLFAAGNKAGAEAFKKLYDRIASGEPVAVYDKCLLDEDGKLALQFFNQNLKNTYIAGDVLTDLKKIEREFLTMIGIPNANTEKRERLITDEVASNDIDTKSLCSQWLETMRDGCRRVNRMFNLNISVEFRFKDETSVNEADTKPSEVSK